MSMAYCERLVLGNGNSAVDNGDSGVGGDALLGILKILLKLNFHTVVAL